MTKKSLKTKNLKIVSSSFFVIIKLVNKKFNIWSNTKKIKRQRNDLHMHHMCQLVGGA